MSLRSAAEAEREADRLRRELAGTLDQIVDNLAPSRLASEAVASAREHTPDWLKRYWSFAQSPLGLAIMGGAAAVAIVGGVTLQKRPNRVRRSRLRR